MICTCNFLNHLTSELTCYCSAMQYELIGIYIGRKQYREFRDSRLEAELFYERFGPPMVEDAPSFTFNGVSFWVIDRPKDHFRIVVDKSPNDRDIQRICDEIFKSTK